MNVLKYLKYCKFQCENQYFIQMRYLCSYFLSHFGKCTLFWFIIINIFSVSLSNARDSHATIQQKHAIIVQYDNYAASHNNYDGSNKIMTQIYAYITVRRFCLTIGEISKILYGKCCLIFASDKFPLADAINMKLVHSCSFYNGLQHKVYRILLHFNKSIYKEYFRKRLISYNCIGWRSMRS